MSLKIPELPKVKPLREMYSASDFDFASQSGQSEFGFGKIKAIWNVVERVDQLWDTVQPLVKVVGAIRKAVSYLWNIDALITNPNAAVSFVTTGLKGIGTALVGLGTGAGSFLKSIIDNLSGSVWDLVKNKILEPAYIVTLFGKLKDKVLDATFIDELFLKIWAKLVSGNQPAQLFNILKNKILDISFITQLFDLLKGRILDPVFVTSLFVKISEKIMHPTYITSLFDVVKYKILDVAFIGQMWATMKNIKVAGNWSIGGSLTAIQGIYDEVVGKFNAMAVPFANLKSAIDKMKTGFSNFGVSLTASTKKIAYSKSVAGYNVGFDFGNVIIGYTPTVSGIGDIRTGITNAALAMASIAATITSIGTNKQYNWGVSRQGYLPTLPEGKSQVSSWSTSGI